MSYFYVFFNEYAIQTCDNNDVDLLQDPGVAQFHT